MQQNAKHSRPNVLPQPEQSGHNVLIPSVAIAQSYQSGSVHLPDRSLNSLTWTVPRL